MRHDLEELRELTGAVQEGVKNAVNEDSNFAMTMGEAQASNGMDTFQQRECSGDAGRAQVENDIDDFTRDWSHLDFNDLKSLKAP